MELGLAAVTEPNTGDIAVKLKDERRRSVDDVISEVRAKVKAAQPVLDVEFIQVLQDMIGDLTGAPEPVVVKLFSPDPELLSTWAPQVAEALEKVTVGGKKPVVDVEDGIENTTSGPAVVFTVNPPNAARAGFTAEELGIVARRSSRGACDGARDRQRASLHAARPLPGVRPRVARGDEQHRCS